MTSTWLKKQLNVLISIHIEEVLREITAFGAGEFVFLQT
jgi:hypothetical protein